ncbi:hypothetical protein ACVBEH_07220 [Roseateles sp. GG27B]
MKSQVSERQPRHVASIRGVKATELRNGYGVRAAPRGPLHPVHLHPLVGSSTLLRPCRPISSLLMSRQAPSAAAHLPSPRTALLQALPMPLGMKPHLAQTCDI